MELDELVKKGRTASQAFSRFLMPLGLLTFLAPFVALMFSASLAVDDFAKAILATPGYICVRQSGLVSAAWSEYSLGSGRWAANLLESLAMNKFNLSWGYGWLLLVVMLSNLLGLSYLFAGLFRVSPIRALLAGTVLYAAWLATVSFPAESLYWLSGAIEYQGSITTLLIVAGILCRSRQTIFSYLTLAALAIAIPAQHEIAGALLVTCAFIGLLISRMQKLPLRPWLVCLGLAALSFASIMLSPGMALKTRYPAGSFAVQILPHVKNALKDGVGWALSPPVLLAALCIPLLLWSDEATGGRDRPPRWLALCSIGAMGVVLAELANAELASGLVEFPPRVLDWFEFIFCVFFLCAVAIGIPEISTIRFSTRTRIATFALFVVSLLASGDFHQAERDVRGPAGPWHRSSIARLMQAGGTLHLDALPPKPALFMETGLSKNTGCWVNQCLAVYVGANAVVLDGPSENHWGGGNPCSDPIPVK